MEVSNSRKRKGLIEDNNQNKKLKQKVGEDDESTENNLAVAVSQPCLGL